jgi:hypothetical protein
VIVISSPVFGIGHLPVAYMILPGATFALTLYVIVANSIFGLIAGYLYWKRGLEPAVLAHVCMLTASRFGACYQSSARRHFTDHHGRYHETAAAQFAGAGCRPRAGPGPLSSSASCSPERDLAHSSSGSG